MMKPTCHFLNNARQRLEQFARQSEGAALVEFAVCLPLTILLLAGAVVLQDSIRVGYVNSKASYTLSDMISREDDGIDADYFEGLESIFDFMTDDRFPTDLRMTVIECTENCTDEDTRVLEVCWSEASNGFAELETSDLDRIASRTPLFVDGDTLLVTETYLDYTPSAFTKFFPSRRLAAISFTRPRLTQQIKFDTGTTDVDGNTVFEDCFNNTT